MVRRKISKNRKQRFPAFLMLVIIGLIGFVYYSQWQGTPSIPFLNHVRSQTAFASEANQEIRANTDNTPVPLILQTDEKWADAPYGTGDGENTMAQNGCAIASLSMVLSYWQGRDVPPKEILDWAQNNYYVADSGTAWTIFPAFGAQFGLVCQDLGNNLSSAQSYLNQGIPVICSVTAGDFTDGGHIMVLRDWTDAGIRVNDPNDDAQKNHYQNTYDPAVIAGQAINYWVYTAG